MRSMPYGGGYGRTIITIEVVEPLTLALDGDAANLPLAMPVELSPEVSRG
jgi:hypothetical protein